MREPANPEGTGHALSASIFGRAREQAILGDALNTLFSGRGRLILLGGAAGIGKTALATAFCVAAAQRGASVLTGRSYDLTDTPPYGPWIIGRITTGHDGACCSLGGDLRGLHEQAWLRRAAVCPCRVPAGG